MLQKVLHQLMPNRCLWCDLPVHSPGQQVCNCCEAALPGFDIEFYQGNLLWLPAVQQGLPKLYAERLLSLSWYQPPFDYAISQWKLQHQLAAGHFLLQQFRQLAQRYQAAGFPLPDCLCYIPMPAWRYLRRGFNQAELLAQTLAQTWQVPVLPLLQRQRSGQHQRLLKRAQRQHNSKRLFQLNPAFRKQLPELGRIALVDDVITTGSTVQHACRCLQQGGATPLQLWTLAITAKDRRAR
ncbi:MULTISPECIES: ComF family protein [Alkalimonas]|uniref:ComF family protein n=1 Tax=Alkalimonas mucilaginosa TaxID=3057676 RepID=A0ABU7JID3_9GAMM|nr:ComF family protein [Alkalimonas sp. MEB004]MEE2025434.1 ComF family protein [Alkalimonas sp. MEB004]